MPNNASEVALDSLPSFPQAFQSSDLPLPLRRNSFAYGGKVTVSHIESLAGKFAAQNNMQSTVARMIVRLALVCIHERS